MKRSVVKVAADLAIRDVPKMRRPLHGNLVVERLSSIGGGVLRAKSCPAKPEGQ